MSAMIEECPTKTGVELFSVVTSGSRGWAKYYSETGPLFLRMGNLDRGTISLDLADIQHVSPPEGSEGTRTRVQEGDILISITADLGMVGIVPPNLGEAYINQHVALARPTEELDHKYGAWFLASKPAQDQFEERRRGAVKAGLRLDDVRELRIPLPPLPEQRRIVARIEELFSRLDAGVAALRHAKAQLQRYRQSVLAAAVTDQLTQAWREQHPDTEPASDLLERILKRRREQWDGSGSYKPPTSPDTTDNLPPNWTPATSDQLLHFVTSGSRGWAKYYSDEGATFLRIGNLEHENIALDLREIQRVTPPKGAEGSRTRVLLNDVLISITADVGMVALADSDIGEAYINQHVALARPSSEIHPRFLAWLLASKPTKDQWKRLQRGATKVGLGLDDIRAVNLGLPPLAEQHQIVAEVEARTTAIDRLEAELDRQITRGDRLRQSILLDAFGGRLVPQNPTDEPALVLLEAARAQQKMPKKKQATKRKTPVKRAKSKDLRAEVIEAINKVPHDQFSFEDLFASINADYNAVKETLFALLGEAEPQITQEFESSSKRIVLTRNSKS